MADKRMFSSKIIGSDQFLTLPLSTQALYFHLGMNADDEGFVGSPRMIARMIGANETDLQLLIAKKFVIGFESGVIVIKHWKINNSIRRDRRKTTTYLNEKQLLLIKDNMSYSLIEGTPLLDFECIFPNI